MSAGFFSTDKLPTAVFEGINKNKVPLGSCSSCKCFADCESPKIPYIGEGKKKILIITGDVTKVEDRSHNEEHNSDYAFLRKILKECGISLEEDCWYTHAVRCFYTGKTARSMTSGCHRLLIQEIKQLKPEHIVVLDQTAWETLLFDRWGGRARHSSFYDWAGEVIPDQTLKCWIHPIFEPRWVREQDEGRYNKFLLLWKQHIMAIQDRKFPVIELEPHTKITTSEEEARGFLDIIGSWRRFAFDYETTGIKPYRKGHEITHASFSNGSISYAFPVTHGLLPQLRSVLTNDAIKIAHNCMFEYIWSKVIIGVTVKNLRHDTQLMQHCNNNKKPTGLKFLSYARYGFLGYDTELDEYIEGERNPGERDTYGTNSFNRMKEAPTKKACLYCALDSLFTYWLYEDLGAELDAKGDCISGYKFFMDAVIALTEATHNGMTVDQEQLDKQEIILEEKLKPFYTTIMRHEIIVKQWDSAYTFNPKSDYDVRRLLYKILKYDIIKYTDKGEPSVDEEALAVYQERCDLIPALLEYRRWYKALNTYVKAYRREQTDGTLHAFFPLSTVGTFRGACIAKGSLVYVVREDSYDKQGVPIEDVRVGDYVYCFDDNGALHLRKVRKVMYNGEREVIRLHYRRAQGITGYLDVTPEHKIRSVSGEYIEASNLMKDTRDHTDPLYRYIPKSRVTALHREQEGKEIRLYCTGGYAGIPEHRFIYNELCGGLRAKEHIHHVDGDHFNNAKNNLVSLNSSDHARIHYQRGEGVASPESREKNIDIVKKMHREGGYTYLYGTDNPRYLGLSPQDCIRHLIKARGCLTKVPYDFDTFKRYCEEYDIDIDSVSLRYNKEGVYLSKWKVYNTIKEHGINVKTYSTLHLGYSGVKRLMDLYGITYNRGYKNQFGFYKAPELFWNNHTIYHIERRGDVVPVYDLEVEEFHNFVVNDICVHNCKDPNLQNVPIRDKEVMNTVRCILMPKRGHKLIEYDYKANEVGGAASISGDPNLIRYVTDPSSDMHMDVSLDLYKLPKERVNKALRNNTKGPFVFASFYGSYWAKTAKGVWDGLAIRNAEEVYGFDVIKHLRSVGIKRYDQWENHVKEQERILWEERFPVYQEWRESTFDFFAKNGYIDYPNGFRYYGPATKNEVLNAPVQGPSFHCQLWCFMQTTKELQERKMNSFFMGQVHDSMVMSVDPAEEQWVDRLIYENGTQLVKEFYPWIKVPLMIEKATTEIDEPWSKKKEIGYLKGGI